MTQESRWERRFQNFSRAVVLLREPIERGVEELSDLEKCGTIQRFEVVAELAWKTLKDYLEEQGTVIDPVTPKSTIKEAFAARIIEDGQAWIDMLSLRSLLSHTYDAPVFEQAVLAIESRFMPAIEKLRARMLARSRET